MVMVVSGNASAARLSHEAAKAGAVNRHARMQTHIVVAIFIGTSGWR